MTVQRGIPFLSIPGPSNLPVRVLNAMHRNNMDINDPVFVAIVDSCLADCKKIFKTEHEVFLYACNGHGAWEAALSNTLAAGDHVLIPETGGFSAGWRETARTLGLIVEELPGDHRSAIDPQAVEAKLRNDPQQKIKAVLAVQTETAAGTTSDLAAVRAAMDAANHSALLMADAVASLGTTDFRMDEWRIDVAISASQKGLMLPAGIGLVAASERALREHRKRKGVSRYWDWTFRLSSEPYNKFCGTAPEHLVFGMRTGLDMIFEEGLDAVFRRHKRLADATRASVEVWSEAGAIEFNAVNPAERADSVTAIRMNGGHDAEAFRHLCRNRFQVSIARGIGASLGRAFRIGHMGDVNEPMLLGTLAIVETALQVAKIPHGSGGILAAMAVLARNTSS